MMSVTISVCEGGGTVALGSPRWWWSFPWDRFTRRYPMFSPRGEFLLLVGLLRRLGCGGHARCWNCVLCNFVLGSILNCNGLIDAHWRSQSLGCLTLWKTCCLAWWDRTNCQRTDLSNQINPFDKWWLMFGLLLCVKTLLVEGIRPGEQNRCWQQVDMLT